MSEITTRLDNLDRAFQRIEEAFAIGGAQRAAAKCVDDLEGVIELYAGSSHRALVQTELQSRISAVRSAGRPYDGADPDWPLTPTWNGLRTAIQQAYVRAWTIQDNLPTRGLGGDIVAAITDPVGLAHSGGRFVGDVVGGAGSAVGGAAGSAVWEVVKSLWPVFAVAGLALTVGVVIAVRRAA
jgi:hypothetical protein